MSTRKFKDGDFVKLSVKAPIWITQEIMNFNRVYGIKYIRIKSYKHNGYSGFYEIELFPNDEKTFNKIISNVLVGYLVLSDKSVFDLLSSSKNHIQLFEDQIKSKLTKILDIEAEVTNLQEKIDFMKKLGLSKYDEDMFKSYNIVKAINSGSSDKDKIFKITEIIKNNK